MIEDLRGEFPDIELIIDEVFSHDKLDKSPPLVVPVSAGSGLKNWELYRIKSGACDGKVYAPLFYPMSGIQDKGLFVVSPISDVPKA